MKNTFPTQLFKRFQIIIFFLFILGHAFCQTKNLRFKDKGFQISFVPGISTNGVFSGIYFNKVSINLFGGYSAGTTRLEIGGISNLNSFYSNGIQIAGIANAVGSNTFVNLTLREERSLISEGLESNFTGIQIAGLVNYVRDNSSGIQITGGINVANGHGSGFQMAGVSNMVGEYYEGIQLAGLYNVALDGVGIQISTLFNGTDGELAGVQVSLINKAGKMRGMHSSPAVRKKVIQIGLVNVAKEMDGVQLGLINFGGEAGGTQIGLINFYKSSAPKEHGKSGTPIALLNFNSSGNFIRLTTDDLFLFSIERTSGNCYNCTRTRTGMPLEGKYKVYNQNGLIFSFNPFDKIKTGPAWGMGYGFQKVLLNKFSQMEHKLNERKQISAGIKLMHLNQNKAFEKEFNLLSKIHAEYGFKAKSLRIVTGLSANFYFSKSPLYFDNLVTIWKKDESPMNYQMWIGYTVGIQL